MIYIGFLRHVLRTRRPSRWNAWLLDFTAKHEGGRLIASRGGIGYDWECKHAPYTLD